MERVEPVAGGGSSRAESSQQETKFTPGTETAFGPLKDKANPDAPSAHGVSEVAHTQSLKNSTST